MLGHVNLKKILLIDFKALTVGCTPESHFLTFKQKKELVKLIQQRVCLP